MTQAFVYKWIHIPTLNWYIGSRTAKDCHPDDGYICSSSLVKPLIKSHPAEWHREILKQGSPKEMREHEAMLLILFNAATDPRSFNKHNGNGKFCNIGPETLETRLKKSQAHKGKSKSAEHRQNIGLGQLGRISPMKGKKNPGLSKALKGKTYAEIMGPEKAAILLEKRRLQKLGKPSPTKGIKRKI